MENNLTNIENNSSKKTLTNNSYEKYFQQSPKINNKKNRPLTGRQNHHFFLDNKIKKDKFFLLSRGTILQKQMKRYSNEELIKIIGPMNKLNKRAGNMNKNKKKLLKNFLGEKKIKINFDEKNEKKTESLNQEKNRIKELNIKIKDPNNINIMDSLNTNINNRTLSCTTTRRRQDKHLPKGYIQYENSLLNSFHKDNNKTYNIKDIKQRAQESDIFFLKARSFKEVKKYESNKDKEKFFNIKLGSDVFNIKNDLNNLMKSGELYLFKKNKIPFSKESNSFWSMKVSTPSYMNYPSVEYNILNPGVKNNTKTREIIYKECLNNKLLNPIYKQKSMGTFYDITKAGMNKNLAYNKLYEENNKVFYKNDDTCTAYFDTYKNYDSLIPKPFFTQANKNVYT